MIAPAVFDQSAEDGTVVVLRERPDGGVLPELREAVHLCPVSAISLTDD